MSHQTMSYQTSHVKTAVFPTLGKNRHDRNCLAKAFYEARSAGIENLIVIDDDFDPEKTVASLKDQAVAIIVPDPVVDVPSVCLSQMIDLHRQIGGNIAALANVRAGDTRRFNIIVPQPIKRRQKMTGGGLKSINILNVIENPGPDVAPSHMALVGCYIADPSLFRYLCDKELYTDSARILMNGLMNNISSIPLHGLVFDNIHPRDDDRKRSQTAPSPSTDTVIGGWSAGYQTTLSSVAFSPLI